MGADSEQCLVGRWRRAREGVPLLLIASYWAQVPLGSSLWSAQHAEVLYCVMPHAMTYMSYMQYKNTYCVHKRAPSPDLQFSNVPLLPLTWPSSWDGESLLEEIHRVVNNIEMSSRKPNLVSLRASCISVKKTHSWELLRITGENSVWWALFTPRTGWQNNRQILIALVILYL